MVQVFFIFIGIRFWRKECCPFRFKSAYLLYCLSEGRFVFIVFYMLISSTGIYTSRWVALLNPSLDLYCMLLCELLFLSAYG